jgi:UrcA family protein
LADLIGLSLETWVQGQRSKRICGTSFLGSNKSGRRTMTALKMFASFSVAAGTAVALLAVPSSAPAKEVTVRHEILSGDQLSRTVSYADLDLASADGVKRLTYRVRGAVNQVCAPHYARDTFVEYHDCRSYAWSGAKPQMDMAVQRAQQIASTGVSSIAPVAILIAVPQK